jgi:hypothetical protein
MDAIADIIPSLWIVNKIPFTQIILLLLAGGLMSLAYNVKKDINELSEEILSVYSDLKGTDTIARACDEDILVLKQHSSIQSEENESMHNNLTRTVLLLESLDRHVNILVQRQEDLEYERANQQWYGILKAQTQYGSLELEITITNTEVFPKIRNRLWLEKIEGSAYMDSVVRDVISVTPLMLDSTRFIQKNLLGFSGSVRVVITWNDAGRYYELDQYLKKFKIVWEKRLVDFLG